MARRKIKQESGSPTFAGPGGVTIQELPPAFEFHKAIQVWVGPPKVGKTSTFNSLREVAKEYGLKEVNPFLMLFEPGSSGNNTYCTSEACPCKKDNDCPDCHGLGTRRLILSSTEQIDEWFDWAAKSPFNPIGIDTGDAMFQVLVDDVCVKLGITAPHQSDHGVAWTDVASLMREKISILTATGKGVVFLMHVYYQERRMKGGATVQAATFNVPGKSRQYINGLANQILFFEVMPGFEDHDKYVITARGRAGVEAGDQWGIFPEELDRGKSPKEGAKAILSVFYDFKE